MAINFQELPQDNPFGLVDPGVYRARISEAEMKQGQDTNKPPYLNIKYTLTDGQGNGKGSLYDIISESDAAVVQYKVARFVRACGIPLVGEMELSDLAKIVKGRDIALDVSHQTDKERGTTRAQVDLFSRQAYYMPSEFDEIYLALNPGAGIAPGPGSTEPSLERVTDANASDVPFDVTGGGASVNGAPADTVEY